MQVWAVIGFCRKWGEEDATVLGSFSLSPGFLMQGYAALAVGGVALLFCLNKDLWDAWRNRKHANSPSVRFQKLYNVLCNEFKSIEFEAQYRFGGERSEGEKFVIRKALSLKLGELDLPSPDPKTGSDDEWYDFLANLLPLAAGGRIEEAKKIYMAVHNLNVS